MLRDAGRVHRADYIADDGFTRSVMANLPEAGAAGVAALAAR